MSRRVAELGLEGPRFERFEQSNEPISLVVEALASRRIHEFGPAAATVLRVRERRHEEQREEQHE